MGSILSTQPNTGWIEPVNPHPPPSSPGLLLPVDRLGKPDTVILYGMNRLTQRQQAILEFIRQAQQERGMTPTYAEIARHFGYRSLTTVADHIRLLRKKGHLNAFPRQARSFQVVSPWQGLRRQVADIPLFGNIPAGFAEERHQEAERCVSIDVGTLGIRPSSRTFALEVQGDSMIGKHIVEGDIVIVEHGASPRPGDVVAALIDNESTLKTYVEENGAPFLRSENPHYPDLIPATELLIQGVMVGLVRKQRPSF